MERKDMIMENKLCEQLYDVALKELTEFEKSLDTVEKALNAANELAVKRDIFFYIENELNKIIDVETEVTIKKYIDSGCPLDLIYDKWFSNEYDNRMEAIRMTVGDDVKDNAMKVARENRKIAAELMEGNYNFTVISFNDENEFAVAEYVEKEDTEIYELDEFKDFVAAQKDITEVDVTASFYIIGEGGEDADTPSKVQMQYINDHLETILDKADLLESNTFTIDVTEIRKGLEINIPDEDRKYIFTVVKFETGDVYALPGVIDDNNIKDSAAWQEVKERNFHIDKSSDLNENIKITYDVYNADVIDAVVPSAEHFGNMKENLENYMIGAEHHKDNGCVYVWKNCDDIIFAMKQHWEEVHETSPSVSDNFEGNSFLLPKEPKVIARFESKEKYNLDDSIEQIKLVDKEWLDVYDACVEMNRRGVNINDVEMLNVRCITDKGDYSSKDMTPEMYVVYKARTETQTDRFKAALQSYEAKHTKLYKKSIAEAKETGMIDLYHKSNRINQACSHMIDVVASANYESNHFHSQDALNAMMERGYSIDRIALVLALNIADKDWDRRLSGENIAWARQYLTEFPAEFMNRKNSYYVTTHPGLLNMFINDVREHLEKHQDTCIDKLDEMLDIADTIDNAIDNGVLDKSEQSQER